MERLLSASTPAELEPWQSPADSLHLDPAALGRDAPNTHWMLVGGRRALRAFILFTLKRPSWLQTNLCSWR